MATPQALSWDNKLGALLIGGLASGLLYGITCTQTYMYFEKSFRDRRSLKLFVAGLWMLDTFDFVLNGHLLYHYLVTNYTNPAALAEKPVWSLLAHVLITSVTDFLVRSMFALRVWRLSNQNIILTTGIVITSLLDLVVGIIVSAEGFSLASMEDLGKLSDLFYINFAAGAGSDVFVAFVLTYFLAKTRTGGSNTRTDSIVDVLILYTINTGLLTAIDAMLGMMLYIVMPNNFIFIAFYLQLSKLYVNAYLATLNNRETLRSKVSGESYYNPTIPTGGAHETHHSLPLSPINARTPHQGNPFRETHVVSARIRQGSDASRSSGRKSFEPIVFTREGRTMADDEDKYGLDP
ncbi:uncharacterized protein STEHIDRAFT_170321 [Stereum hirsutum FP-91666 SS1]|uniref:uncharacterized protein n=1 Tax=Stereum hirsutum (strain FP-91666) TaxID=721885 RepID=UPI00044496F1|nr:uncharacterized protein STEHIDRAFT_170321 [Stereum hirsutum FP-91666 SS1]EIM83858.1 hypothetical protein STEHIDRAFT_170321 [Stereum hirsutum FP-91666 SS1]